MELSTIVGFCRLKLPPMVFILVLGNRSQSDLPVQIFLLYRKQSEASDEHFGFFTLPRLRIRYKPIYLVHMQSVALSSTGTTIANETTCSRA